MRGLGVIVVLALAACGGSDREEDSLFGSGGSGTAEDGTAEVGSNSLEAGSDPSAEAGEEGPKFDVMGTATATATAGDTTGDGCTAVDILFVIDNSASMGPKQEQLAFAWPTFVDAMWENLPNGTKLHVGMTTTSFFTGSCSESTLNCQSGQTPAEIDMHYIPPTQGDTGTNGEQGRLFEWDQNTFFATTVGGDPWPTKIWFAEAATAAGETGCSYEMMSAGAGYAFHSANAAHNMGFVRDVGAVLVIFFLTDEPDKSPEGAQTYFDMVVGSKQGCGGADCVLTAGIVDTCIMGNNDPLWQFMNLFPEPPVVGSIDDPAGYQDVIGTTLAEIIGQKCEEIPPEG